MLNNILADYYEHNLLIKKAQRLRRRSARVIYWFYNDKSNLWFTNYSPFIYIYNDGCGNNYVFTDGFDYGYITDLTAGCGNGFNFSRLL